MTRIVFLALALAACGDHVEATPPAADAGQVEDVFTGDGCPVLATVCKTGWTCKVTFRSPNVTCSSCTCNDGDEAPAHTGCFRIGDAGPPGEQCGEWIWSLMDKKCIIYQPTSCGA